MEFFKGLICLELKYLFINNPKLLQSNLILSMATFLCMYSFFFLTIQPNYLQAENIRYQLIILKFLFLKKKKNHYLAKDIPQKILKKLFKIALLKF